MGEIADMMIDGTMCPCGVFIDDGADGPGYQRFCSRRCERDYGGGEFKGDAPPVPLQMPKVACPTCSKKISMTGIADHWRAVHGLPPR